MGEKRFIMPEGYDDTDVTLIDRLDGIEYEDNFEDIVKVLNELWDTCLALREELFLAEEENDFLEKENQKLKENSASIDVGKDNEYIRIIPNENNNELYDYILKWEDKEIEKLCDENKKLKSKVNMLKQDELIFFQATYDILMKYQYLFNRDMADEVLEELGIELTDWFE